MQLVHGVIPEDTLHYMGECKVIVSGMSSTIIN